MSEEKMTGAEAMALMVQWAEMRAKDDDADEWPIEEIRDRMREARGFVSEEDDPICSWLRDMENAPPPKREYPFKLGDIDIIMSEPFIAEPFGGGRHTEMVVGSEDRIFKGFRVVEEDGTKRWAKWRLATDPEDVDRTHPGTL